MQDWRGLAYEVEGNRWEYLCPECAEKRDYLDERAIDDVECPECGQKRDVERVGLHDVDDRRRKVLACNECGHVYTRPASRAHTGAEKDLYQYLTTDARTPILDEWVMVPSSSLRDDELVVYVFHAADVVMDEFDGRLHVEYEAEEIGDRVWAFRVEVDDVREAFDEQVTEEVGDVE
ncbi:hypothetical protein [Halopenitus persicus]|uniref:hypothetical protein n=1 Tax=Halopenitus persicus TaxID=1048396 RepID=UPI0012FD8DC3|nr:hypothetical protein [Halopenitus persicus]